jgi:hypothetical protein
MTPSWPRGPHTPGVVVPPVRLGRRRRYPVLLAGAVVTTHGTGADGCVGRSPEAVRRPAGRRTAATVYDRPMYWRMASMTAAFTLFP